MNVNKVLTNAYEEKTLGEHGKNEPKTNPIKANQSQLKPIKCQNKPNTNPIRTQSKPISKAKNAVASVFKRGGPKGFDLSGLNMDENMDYKHDIFLIGFDISSGSLPNKLSIDK